MVKTSLSIIHLICTTVVWGGFCYHLILYMTKLRYTKDKQISQSHTAGRYKARIWTKQSDSRNHTLLCVWYYPPPPAHPLPNQREQEATQNLWRTSDTLQVMERWYQFLWYSGELPPITGNIWWLGLCFEQRIFRGFCLSRISLDELWWVWCLKPQRDLFHPSSTLAVSPAFSLKIPF